MTAPPIQYNFPVYNLTAEPVNTMVKGRIFSIPAMENGKAGVLATTEGYAKQLVKQHPDKLTMDALKAAGMAPKIDSTAVLAGMGAKELVGVIRYFTALQVEEADLRKLGESDLRVLATHAVHHGYKDFPALPSGK